MRTFEVSNVGEAYSMVSRFIHGWKALPNDHDLHCRPSRYGDVIEFVEPITTIYRRPWECVLLDPGRDANPWLHMMEALWCLAGRNDVAFSARYAARMAEFSDDGVTRHGAYGYRWRQHWRGTAPGDDRHSFLCMDPVDQLESCVQLLLKDPDDRRAVLTMWDPAVDLGRQGKDLPSLAGDTVVLSPEGNFTIAELSKKFAAGMKRWPVYGINEKTKQMQLTWCTKVWKNGIKPTLKITFDDGSSIRATRDHKFYKRGRSAVAAHAVEAEILKPGDRVLATRFWKDPKGYLLHKRRLGENTNFSNMVKIHREYAKLLDGTIPEGIDVHHVNGNIEDNRSENLERMSHEDHAAEGKAGVHNPHCRMSEEARAARGRKHSVSLKAAWARITSEERSLRARGLPLDNHVVVSTEICDPEPVYDFTISDLHTALVGTGVVTHNCNTQVYLKVRQGKLIATVTCRSNDMILGAYGANAVEFAFLQAYVAARLGLPMGCLTQVSDSLHVYTQPLHGKPWSDYPAPRLLSQYPGTQSLCSDPESFIEEVECFCDDRRDRSGPWCNEFLEGTALPMKHAWGQWKKDNITGALQICGGIDAPDWRVACTAWLERRAARRAEKEITR
jgi:hypothetical protein